MRYTRLLVSAVATLAVAACADDAPTAVQSLDGGSPSLASTKGIPEVVPGARFVAGNISGDGNAVCRNVLINLSGRSVSGVKVDPPQSMTIAGYAFTISPGGQFLSFTQVTPGSSIVAVVVKGGPDTFVYEYPAGTTSGSGLRSPRNGGGNIPGISHYSVCFTPAPPPPEHDWTVKKEILGYFLTGNMSGGLQPGSVITLPGFCAGEPSANGCVIWVQYKITVTKSAGSFPIDASAIVTDDLFERCDELKAATGDGLVCLYPDDPATRPVAVKNLDGSTTWTYFNDIWNRHVCGKSYRLVNTAKLTESGPNPPGGEVRTSSATLTINTPACKPGQSFP